MKKFILIFGFVALALLIAAFVFLKGKRHEITITQQQIDAKLGEMFPAEQTYFVIFHLAASHPTVTLLAEVNRVQVEMDVRLNLKIPVQAQTLDGKIIVTSGIRYDTDQKAFFLTEPVIKNLQIEGVPQNYLEKVALVATTAANDFLSEQPIYSLTGTDVKTAAAKLLLKKVEVKEREIVLSLGI